MNIGKIKFYIEYLPFPNIRKYLFIRPNEMIYLKAEHLHSELTP